MNASNSKREVIRLNEAVPEEITKRVGSEVLKRDFEPSTWAQALAMVSGRRDEALAAYSRLRIAQLMSQRERVQRKAESMEFRRLNACLGVKTVKELLQGMSRVGALNLPRPRVPVLWLALLTIGFAGCLTAFVRLADLELPGTISPWLPAAALACGLAVVAVVLLVSRFLSPQLLSWLWGEGVVGACGLICLCSLLLGTRLVMKHPLMPAPAPDAPVAMLAPAPADPTAPRGLLAPGYEVPQAIAMADPASR